MIWIQFEITRPVAAIKSLRFALFIFMQHFENEILYKFRVENDNESMF